MDKTIENKGKLYLIPTPLAEGTHQQVLPIYLKEIILKINHFFVEDIRTARRFISAFTHRNIEELHFYEIGKHALAEDIDKNFKILHQGHDVGVLSEAGCPGIADPGAIVVAMAHQQAIEVIPLVGPSSIIMALMASGFNGQSFTFHGYLPIDKNERAQSLKNIEKDIYQKNQTQIFIETPFRNNQIFKDILTICKATTQLCICCNLTAPDAYIKTYSIQIWRKQNIDLHKKPAIFLLFS